MQNAVRVRIALFAIALLSVPPAPVPAQRTGHESARYLAFQVFTGAPDPAVAIGGSGTGALGAVPTTRSLDSFAADLVRRLGTTGRGNRRLAIVFGPLSFDQNDAQIRGLVRSAFSIALARNVAVGFHIDDSMFWAARRDLWSLPENVEWSDWSGTPNTGRRLDWGPKPMKIPPQMCLNSPAIEAEVRRRAAVIGKAISAGRERLASVNRAELFAGVIAGWETQIGQDFDSGRPLGYHALANRGFSKAHPPADMDAERERVVEGFIRLWTGSLAKEGLPAARIYSHVAFIPRRLFQESTIAGETYSRRNHFAPPPVAFGGGRRAGFSTYPQPGLFEQIYAELRSRGNPPWASSEGTNLQLGAGPGQSGMDMETYLAKMFNHGAALVNIFSWGVGGEANRKMDFRVATESEEAIAAYRKFLNGGALRETPAISTVMERLPAKIHRIQAQLPEWIQRTHGEARAKPLMRRLDSALKANNLAEAEAIADQLLNLLTSH